MSSHVTRTAANDMYGRCDMPASISIPTWKAEVIIRLRVHVGMASHPDRSGESTGT